MLIHISAYINMVLHFQIHTHIFLYTHVLVNIYGKSKLFPYKASEDLLFSLANYLPEGFARGRGSSKGKFFKVLEANNEQVNA